MGERYSGLLDMLIFNLCRMKGAEFSDDGLLKAVHLPKRHSTQTTPSSSIQPAVDESSCDETVSRDPAVTNTGLVDMGSRF